MDIDLRTNTTPARAPIEVGSAADFQRLRKHWMTLPAIPKVVSNRDDAPFVSFPGQETRILLRGEESAGAAAIFDSYTLAGFEGGEHYQPNEEEYWFILDGEMEITVGKEKAVVGGGAFAFMPRNCTHAFRLLTDTHVITINAPAGHDRAFEALSRLFSDGHDVAPEAPVKTVANHEMVLYLDNPERHPIDQLTNAKPALPPVTDEAGLRRAWADMPMLPKLLTSRDQGRDVSSPGVDARLLLGPDESSGRYTMLDLIVAPGFEQAAERTADETRWWYVLDGELDVTIGSTKTTLRAGGFAFAPAGATHAMANRSGKPVSMISVQTSGPADGMSNQKAH